MAILTTLAGLSAAYTRIEARVVAIARRFDLLSEEVADFSVLAVASAMYCTGLTALVAVDRARVYCDGYAAAGDGGGGDFVWYLGSVTAANGGTVFGAGTGRWKRVYSGAVNVEWFGADRTGVTSSTSAIQAAINTGLDIEFPPGFYRASNLVQTADNQRFTCTGGIARIEKNAHGVIFASSGSYVKMQNIEFRGESSTPTYTGHNATFSGNYVTLNHCGSYNAYACAVKATGASFTINGSCSIYNTTAGVDSAGDTNYDIEIGVYNTATLYHKIIGINSTQRKGGYKFIDTGAALVLGCEFGKLFFDYGAGAAGGGSGMVIGNRIHGTTVCNQSNGRFTGNLWAQASKIEFGLNTSQIVLDLSNNIASVTLVSNLGNANNVIERESSLGSYNALRTGDDSSTHIVTKDTDAGITWFPGIVRLPNNNGLALADYSDGAYTGQVNMTTSNNLSIANTHASGSVQVVCNGAMVQLLAATKVQLSGASGGVECANYLTRKTEAAVTASTTRTQAGGIAVDLTGDFIQVSVCANANDTIALPTAVAGREVTVVNDGANTLKIYPYTSDDLGAGVDTSTTLAAGGIAQWFAINGSTWKRIV